MGRALLGFFLQIAETVHVSACVEILRCSRLVVDDPDPCISVNFL